MTGPVSAFSAAKRLGDKSGWTLTHLQIHKMLYLCHMFFLGDKEEPLIQGDFEAWNYGPVHPQLYHRLKRYDDKQIPESAFFNVAIVEDSHPGAEYLDAGVEQLPRHRLVAITHWENGAWLKNFQPYVKGIVIPEADIVEEYKLRKGISSDAG